MDFTDLLGAVLPSVIVGVFMAFWNRQQKRRDDRERTAKEDQLENDLMRIDLELASAQLAYAVAMAYRRGTPNGEMEEAIHQYEKAMASFRKFERRQIAKNSLDN